MSAINRTKGTEIAAEVELADTFFSRMRGLLGRRELNEGQALLITRCQSIHMFFMRFPIDVIFVDKNNVVVGLTSNIRPFQLSPVFFKSSFVLECPAGTIADKAVSVGDQLDLQK